MPVTCKDTQYKGYLFIKCYQPNLNGNTSGGLYVVSDEVAQSGGFVKYAVNGQARTHLEVIYENAGQRYEDLDELPLPLPEWLDISEINKLIDKGENFKDEYVRQPLF